jgi:uncharacterized phage-like protein YoqJ
MTTIAITGHRPDRIPNSQYVRVQLDLAFHDFRPDRIYLGMAYGADLMAAKAAYYAKVPYAAVRPWAGHRESIPEGYWRKQWDKAWKYADERIDISTSQTFPGNHVYHQRNKYMIDRADTVVAVWDGIPKGGTYETVKLALRKRIPVHVIDVDMMETRWLLR